MNVFDSEMGPICDQSTAEEFVMLAEAGCTIEEAGAYWLAAMKPITEAIN